MPHSPTARAFVHGLLHCSAETRVRAIAICSGFVTTGIAEVPVNWRIEDTVRAARP
ncbi:MAG: hypothetical protein HRU39_08265 [Salinicola sp.]|uniref:hypothetical protein n=1 Tax=Salinicola sp. TaxID=1978524 RepID=UPI001DD1E3A8|nr:hypothetical protein [Salinicola sp.]NRB55956.1 hypothetical protein [Salinicola sp.]